LALKSIEPYATLCGHYAEPDAGSTDNLASLSRAAVITMMEIGKGSAAIQRPFQHGANNLLIHPAQLPARVSFVPAAS